MNYKTKLITAEKSGNNNLSVVASLLLLCSLIGFLLYPPCSISQQKNDEYPRGKISGVLFADYFNKITGDSTGSQYQYSQFKKGTQGFAVRRIRFIYEHFFSENFNSGIIIEGNDMTKLDGRMSIVFIQASLEWKNIIPYGSVVMGLMPSPTFVWGLSEKLYGYRSVEKTIADMNGIGQATDLGLLLRGDFDKKSTYGYKIMLGNGNGNKPEFSKFLKYYGSIWAKPINELTLEVYADYHHKEEGVDRTTLKGIADFKTSVFNIGVEYVYQLRNKFYAGGANAVPMGISGYFNFCVLRSKEKNSLLEIFLRYDLFNTDTQTKNSGFINHFGIAGLDIQPIKYIHIMPNLWFMGYQKKDANIPGQKSDVSGRLTIWCTY